MPWDRENDMMDSGSTSPRRVGGFGDRGERDVDGFLRDYVSPEEGDISPALEVYPTYDDEPWRDSSGGAVGYRNKLMEALENIPRMTDLKEVELDTRDSKARQLEAAMRAAQHRSFTDMMRPQPAAMDSVFGNSWGSYAR